MGGEWKWDCWEDAGNDEEVEVTPEADRHDGPHGLKSGVGNRFKTILQRIMTATAMNIEFFQIILAQSNEHTRNDMHSRKINSMSWEQMGKYSSK